MKAIKAGRPLIELVKLCYQSDLPLLLIGKHGVGKSELLELAAKELKVDYICRDLSLMEPPDLIGLPEKNLNTTRYLPPNFLPTKGRGILTFEELNRCPSYMRAPCLQLLTARALNDYTLPAGWLPVAAINPPEEGYEVQELDPALLSRFVKVLVIADRKEWLGWAGKKGIQESILAYIEFDSKIFQDTSPRDWTMASTLLLTAQEEKTPQNIVDLALAGIVGRERYSAFKAFLKGGPPLPSAKQLLSDYPEKYKKQVKSLLDSQQIDSLEQLCYSLKVFLQNPDAYDEFIMTDSLSKGRDIWLNLGAFLADIPPDLCGDVLDFLQKHDYAWPPPFNKDS